MYPVKPYQTSYTMPIGEDLYGTGSFSDFQKVYVIVQALSDTVFQFVGRSFGKGYYQDFVDGKVSFQNQS